MATIGTKFARNNVIEYYSNRDPFWDPRDKSEKYSELNKVIVPTNEQIRAYQIEKIERLEKLTMQKKFKKLDPITKANFQGIISRFESEENAEVNEALETLVTKINGLYYVNKEDVKSEADWKTIQTRLRNVQKALQSIMTQLNAPVKNQSGQPTVLGTSLETLEQAITACNLNSLDVSVVNDFLKTINQLKGNLLEELGVAYFRNLRIPAVDSIRLGSVYLNTDGRKGRHSGQLIQDLMFYNIDSPDLLNDVEVEYKLPGEDKYIKASLKQLFADIEKANGGSKQITITDETYDVITNLEQISVQAKSGKNQLPWNKNKSTSVSISEYGKDNLSLSIKATFKLLTTLNSKEKQTQPWSIKDQSSDYNALANYGLATVLFKVLHLSEEGNQYLLTPYGFMTYSERMRQLLKTENYIALLQDNIVLNSDTMTTKHAVGISKN